MEQYSLKQFEKVINNLPLLKIPVAFIIIVKLKVEHFKYCNYIFGLPDLFLLLMWIIVLVKAVTFPVGILKRISGVVVVIAGVASIILRDKLIGNKLIEFQLQQIGGDAVE